MWQRLASAILKARLPLLLILIAITAFMGWQIRKVQLSYEFTNAIPTNNPEAISYQDFRKTFGEDGTTLVTGVKKEDFFNPAFFPAIPRTHPEMGCYYRCGKRTFHTYRHWPL